MCIKFKKDGGTTEIPAIRKVLVGLEFDFARSFIFGLGMGIPTGQRG